MYIHIETGAFISVFVLFLFRAPGQRKVNPLKYYGNMYLPKCSNWDREGLMETSGFARVRTGRGRFGCPSSS